MATVPRRARALLQLLRRRSRLLLTGGVLLAVPALWLVARSPAAADAAVVARVQRGPFRVTVTTSGELQAREAVQITAPANAQQAGAYQMQIASLVPEGTVVKEGDVVAQIDRSQVANRMEEVRLALEKAEAQYEQAMLDSALTLSTARETIRNMELSLEEKRLAVEQAVYEAPTVKRQAEIDYERAQRQLAQARADYQTRTEQAQAKMREVGADVSRQRNLLNVVQSVMQGFTIRAPAPGMVIYVKEWNGRKRTSGSRVTSWDPAVATLPDLTQMESVTYVNEIDVRHVAEGQEVAVTLDADPTKRLTGTVTTVANVGEQRPNADAKVFEVHVRIAESDTTLRPGMTTGNTIETLAIADALFVPLEAVFSEGGVPFVYRRSGGGAEKREIATGAVNENEVVVLRGLAEGDEVLLAAPDGADRMELRRLPESASGPESPVAGGDTALAGAEPPDTTGAAGRR